MATGKFTVSVNGVVVHEFEQVILTEGQTLILNPRFEVQHEAVTIIAPLPDIEPALPRRENGKPVL